MPQTTQCTSSLDKVGVAMTNPKSINVVPNCCLSRYPIVSNGSIITTFKNSCQQFKPIQSSQDTSTADLQKMSCESVYQICKGWFTGRDYDGTKSNGWFGPNLIYLYLSWLLHTCKIHNRSLKSIMMLPFSIFRKFEVINYNTNNLCATSLYNDLVKKQKRDIFDISLVFIFIYWEFCWSLAVLVDFGKVTSIPIKKRLRIAIKNPRLIHVKKRMTNKVTGRLFFISYYVRSLKTLIQK